MALSPRDTNAIKYPIILSGCSSGGKSTLLNELSNRGYLTFGEAGRRVVQKAIQENIDALPWNNPVRFCEEAATLAIVDYEAALSSGKASFMDRSIIDLHLNLNLKASELPVPENLSHAFENQRFHKLIFLAPPWEDIFQDDGKRNKDFSDAAKEYDLLLDGYKNLGFSIEILAKTSVTERADFVERAIFA